MKRVAILGAGIGAEHLAAYRKLSDAFEVAVICDLDVARAKAIAGDIKVSTQTSEALADPSIDLIDICLPPHLHVPMTLKALESGKSVICEKPLTTSLADVDRLEVVENASKGSVFPVFQYRFGRAMNQLYALREASLLGRPQVASLETHWSRESDYYSIPWRGTWAGEQGGSVVSHAIHVHDLLMHLFGPVAKVSANLATRINDIETEDCAALNLEMKNGALATSSITLGGADDTTRLRLVFEHLTATSGQSPYAPMDQDWQFQARDAADQQKVDEVVRAISCEHSGFVGYLNEVARAMVDSPNRAVTLQDGRASVDLITAIYGSARSDRPEVCPVGSKHDLYAGWQP